MRCFKCLKDIKTVTGLLIHFILIHSLERGPYECVEYKCHRTFDSLKSFKKHIVGHTKFCKRGHKKGEIESRNDSNLVENNEVNGSSNNHYSEIKPSLSTMLDVHPALEDAVLNFISKLHDYSSLPRSIVQRIITEIQEFLNNKYFVALKNNLLKLATSNAHTELISSEFDFFSRHIWKI